jgi:hypothetical protein
MDHGMTSSGGRKWRGRAVALSSAAMAHASPAVASFLSGETLDNAANVLSWVILFLVPVVAIVVFWMVHVLPEKIAHKRHHPQRQAIQTLCLLSLVFGGLLWPIAWLWAYTRPVGYKAAFGTDKHEDFFGDQLAKALKGELTAHELDQLEAELDSMEARAALAPELRKLRDELAARHAPPAGATGAAAVASPTGAGSA